MFLFGTYSKKNHLPIDYHEKKLENPFFKRKDRIIPLTGLKAKIITLAVILFLIFIFWFLFISSFWKIKEISVIGLDQAAGEEIKNIITKQISAKKFFFLPQNNLIFFKDEKILETLKNSYRFQRINIEKKWPSKLVVEIAAKPLSCVWIESGKYYYADLDGFIIQEVNPLDLKDKTYPLISNESSARISNSKIQVEQLYFQVALQLYEKFTAKLPETAIDRFIIDDEVDTIKIQTLTGLKISFDAKGDLDRQIDRLYILKTQKLKDDFANKKKIDLRFGDKIYYQ